MPFFIKIKDKRDDGEVGTTPSLDKSLIPVLHPAHSLWKNIGTVIRKLFPVTSKILT
jgi:hypothetical protein